MVCTGWRKQDTCNERWAEARCQSILLPRIEGLRDDDDDDDDEMNVDADADDDDNDDRCTDTAHQ